MRLLLICLSVLGLSSCATSSSSSSGASVSPSVASTPQRSPMRQANLARLEADGFSVAPSLPEGRVGGVRPHREVAGRLMALKALFLRTVAPEQALPEALVAGYVERNGLEQFLTPDELQIWRTPRADAPRLHGNSIGWRLENIWALAWVLGHDVQLSYAGGQVGPDEIEPIFGAFTPTFTDGTLDAFVAATALRSKAELIQMEDLLYCAHNAVRSAQLGHDTVPPGFHPLGDGGTVHERRQVLTWVLSTGVSWDETDLST